MQTKPKKETNSGTVVYFMMPIVISFEASYFIMPKGIPIPNSEWNRTLYNISSHADGILHIIYLEKQSGLFIRLFKIAVIGKRLKRFLHNWKLKPNLKKS